VSSHGCISSPCPICAPLATPSNIYVGDSWARVEPKPQRLAPEDVEAIAQRVAALLRGEPPKGHERE
jgi:hypothetical protein